MLFTVSITLNYLTFPDVFLESFPRISISFVLINTTRDLSLIFPQRDNIRFIIFSFKNKPVKAITFSHQDSMESSLK